MDKLGATKYFLKVAQTGSFSKAAKYFGQPVSTVSRRIKYLEESLQAKLFNRSTRYITLTEQGEVYLEYVEEAVSAFELAEDMVIQNTGNPSGTIRISALPSYADIHLYSVIQQFQLLYPEITIDLIANDHVHNLVRDKIDFAIRATSNPPIQFIAKVLDNHNMGLFVSPSYLNKFGPIENIGEIKFHQTLCYCSISGALPWFAFHNGKWTEIEKRPHFICNNTEELLKRVCDGEGIALLPEWTTSANHRHNNIIKLDMGAEVSFVTDFDHRLYLIYEKKNAELKKNKLFLEFVKKQLL